MAMRGFSLFDLLFTISLFAVLAAIALPSLSHHIVQSRITQVPPALTALASTLEQARLKNRSYNDGHNRCALAEQSQSALEHFEVTCELANEGKKFKLTARSLPSLAAQAKQSDYVYTVDSEGNRETLRFAGKSVNLTCWRTRESDLC